MSIPYPEDDYVILVGRLAYAVTYLEVFVVNDLYRLRDHVPPELALEKLAGKTTGAIASQLEQHADKAGHSTVVAWFIAAGPLLNRAAKIRNPVLHARPMTTGDNKQEMFRWIPHEQFPITPEHLRQGIAELEDMVDELGKHRPSLQDFPPH